MELEFLEELDIVICTNMELIERLAPDTKIIVHSEFFMNGKRCIDEEERTLAEFLNDEIDMVFATFAVCAEDSQTIYEVLEFHRYI